ncbi:poly [ADP-ribose] polymerase tankyrase-1-like [Strongylocentrotus purpuratus]|uniref:Ankyrin repeat domain-containing protein 49 n=1 Tax=Strongylocentrotus purpuratus TaxID=7668 RepID=A0A7M7SZK8_STRPU|nr:poly [ADP-ribose] polymerase tankyrase-1-like [Strongylocentrotus purpuratus]|eukprot:XP_003728472.1 PREDICTED: tankyrase-1 [Strongylocentrotus purpuratus]
MMDVCSEQTKELSESVESLDKEFRERVARHRTDRRLSVPRIGTDLTFKQEEALRRKKDEKEEEEEEEEDDEGEGGAVGGVEIDAEGVTTPERCITVEDCGELELDLTRQLVPSNESNKERLERLFQAGIERQNRGDVTDDNDEDDEETARKARRDTEFLLNIMESEKEKKQRRGSWKSVWDDDDPEEDSKINEDIENDTTKRILWAAENNEIETAKDLLDSTPTLIGVKDEDGYTPLHRATYNGHTAMVEFLLERGADMCAQTTDGWQPIHCAARWNNPCVASLLVQAGCDVNAMTNGGQTPLHLAACSAESEEVLSLLLMSRFIDTTLKNAASETAYDIARRTGRLVYLFEAKDPHMLPSTS